MIDMILSSKQSTFLYSGSYAEGFRLRTSDRDVMIWNNSIRAVCDINQTNPRDVTNVLLMEPCDYRPGFFLLKVLSLKHDILKQCVTVRYHCPYLDASKYKIYFLSQSENFHEHGPCCTTGDIDIAYCMKCDCWPTQAKEFITRSNRRQWPSISVVDKIVKNGCHVVPVGARFSEIENLEWRISFSVAEKILISTFSHTQFLIYGLLKLVLHEVINKETHASGLLCSYYIKTVVFWEIQENNSTVWQPENTLTGFWKCIDRLILWVSYDYSPNFFIPEINMFCGKFTVKQQHDLYNYLQLLRSDENYLFYRIPNLMLVQVTDDITPVNHMYTRYEEYDKINNDILGSIPPHSSEKLQLLFVQCLSHRQKNTGDAPAIVIDITLDNVVNTLLFRALNDLVNSTQIHNKDRYKIYRPRLYPYMRYLSSSSPCSRLYLATVLYTLGQYHAVLNIVTTVQSKAYPLNFEYPIFPNDPDLRKHLCPLLVFREEDNVKELVPELRSLIEMSPIFTLPPLLYIKWLTFMCYHHMKDTGKCKQALDDLHVLLFIDDRDIFVAFMDCVYYFIALCYELCGDYQTALLMYRTSMDINGQYCTAAACKLAELENRMKQHS